MVSRSCDPVRLRLLHAPSAAAGLVVDDARCEGVLQFPSSALMSAPCSVNSRGISGGPSNDTRYKGRAVHILRLRLYPVLDQKPRSGPTAQLLIKHGQPAVEMRLADGVVISPGRR
jgi:hypothetical protein